MPKKRKNINKKNEQNEIISKKKQEENQNKILKVFIIGMVVLVLVIVLFVYGIKLTKKFEYKGVNFEVIKEGNLVLYNTQVPVVINGKSLSYNFYLRNDPRKTVEEVPIDGEIVLKRLLVINSSEDFNCNGEGIIAIANILNLYKISGINVIRDDNATCDYSGRYAFIRIQAGDKTSIEEFGPSCYNLNINNCGILKGTERLMIESFVDINKLESNKTA